MSTRNPIRGKRRQVKAGDRFTYVVPDGPPADAIAAFAGDAQSAITAALTLLSISLRGRQVLSLVGAGQVASATAALAPGSGPEETSRSIEPGVLGQDFL